MLTVIVILIALNVAVYLGKAFADGGYRSWPMPKSWRAWHYPEWQRQALCIHRHESTDWHIHNEPYANGFQFMQGTWMRAGGRSSTWFSATPREQLYRARMIWEADGGSWREWPNTSRMCGAA